MSRVLEKLNIQLKSSNFDFMKLDYDLASLYKTAAQAEIDFALEAYDNAVVNAGKVAEALTDLVIDQNYGAIPYRATWNERLMQMKKYAIPRNVVDAFYDIKKGRNQGAHDVKEDINLAYKALQQLRIILCWYMKQFSDVQIRQTVFIQPTVVSRFKNNQERKLIYIQTADNSSGLWPAYEGAEKIGETTAPEEDLEEDWSPNSEFLRSATRRRLNGYMKTAGVPAKIDWSELAWKKATKSWFGDTDVHEVLRRSGYKNQEDLEGAEWFHVDLETAKAAIKAVKDGRKSLVLGSKEETTPIILRDEQKEAIKQAKRAFKKNNKVLWNAKMRFGKTLSAYELIKQNGYQRVLVMTHRPVVSDSWFDDFKKIKMSKAGYEYASKDMGEKSLTKLLKGEAPFIYFASIQDLRGSEEVGGKHKKNSEFFQTEWDLIVVDEAHEGTQTERGDKLYGGLIKENTKVLELSGTPFNIIDEFNEEQVFTWDYIMEQQAKIRFSVEHPDKVNPYETLPEVEMYTFKMATDRQYQNADKYFDFMEFFTVDGDDNKFVHESSVSKWLDEISADNGKTMYPFSTEEYRESIRHTMWLLPGIKEAKALKKLLDKHPVFSEYDVLNIVSDNDDEVSGDNDPDMERVRAAITDKPSETKTIILTVRKLTTGVNIPALNAVVFLNNTTSAQNYLQAAFRAQTPFSDEVLGMKKKAYIFDFAPDRALNILAKSVSMSPKAGALNSDEQKEKLGILLNFLPVLEQSGNEMKPYEVSTMMRQLKNAYAERAVLAGFDDASIYNDELWSVTQEDAVLFNELEGRIGKTKQSKRTVKVDINITGLNESEREKANRGKRKPPKERTDKEIAAIAAEQKMRKEQKNMVAILRGISIRIPLMIYGMDMDVNKDIGLDDFVDSVDQVSWEEFMPKGITKGDFKKFKKFYDPEIFVEAGHRIRQAALFANNLRYQDRVEKITAIFSSFKNPDKETVLTPWRVVNRQLGLTLGGCNFFDEDFEQPIDNGSYREIDNGEITEKVFSKDAKILEINSKTGLYPLYMAFSIYQRMHNKKSDGWAKADYVQKDKELWQEVLENNIFVLNKTPMARTITYRTLNGYTKNEKVLSNLIYVENLVDKLKKDINETTQEIMNQFGGNIVKFDAVVGNPPYQNESVGASTSSEPIYNYFYDLSEQMSTRYCLISPARFLSKAGSTPKNWNDKMLDDEHIKVVFYEQKSANVFPNTDIKGGIVIIYRDAEKEFGKIGTFTTFVELSSVLDKTLKQTVETLDTIITGRGVYRLTDKAIENHPEVEKIQSKGHTRDVGTGAFKILSNIIYFEKKPNDGQEYIRIIGLLNNERVYRWIRKDFINTPFGFEKYKVILPKANGSGAIGEVLSTPLVGEPLVGFTETFISIGAFDSEVEAQNCLKYVKSKFARTMLGVLKVTQDNPREKWIKVPMQDFTQKSDIDWTKSILEIDQQLYAKYGLDEKEIAFIEEKVKAME